MYSEHIDNSVTDIVTNIELVKIQRILNGSHPLKMILELFLLLNQSLLLLLLVVRSLKCQTMVTVMNGLHSQRCPEWKAKEWKAGLTGVVPVLETIHVCACTLKVRSFKLIVKQLTVNTLKCSILCWWWVYIKNFLGNCKAAFNGA